jgi:ABC-type transporter Mla subunit MlaD
MSLDAMKQALEALETNQYAVADTAPHADVMTYNDAIDTLRLAIEQAEKLAERQQPDALRLADALETLSPLERDAAAELRRLHSVNAQLLEALGNLEEYSKRMGNVASNLAAIHARGQQ